MKDTLLPRHAKHIANGTEQPAVREYNELTGESEFIGVAPDPREEIYTRIDGPELLDRKKSFMGWADELAELLDFICCDERAGNVPPHDCGVRAIGVRKLIRGELTARVVQDRYGISRQSISQVIALFRERFGEVATLRTRSPEQRRNMSEAQGRVNHWKRRKEKPPESRGTQAGAKETEPKTDSISNSQNVNCAHESEGAK